MNKSRYPNILDKYYLGIRYILNYNGIWHKKPKKYKAHNKFRLFFDYYGELYITKDLDLRKWLPKYCLALIREGICPILEGKSPITLSGPMEPVYRSTWGIRRDRKNELPHFIDRCDDLVKRNIGRTRSLYNYGTNTNPNK